MNTFTDAQARALHLAAHKGLALNITRRDDDTLTLHLVGYDIDGSPVTASMDATGQIVGHPIDPARAPEKFAIGAPASEAIS